MINTNISEMCTRCKLQEGSKHKFSTQKHMHPIQPHVLRDLTQVQEMLISHVNPILQCGQYKYRGHPISFPQEIKTIANALPQHIKELDIIIVIQKI